MVNMVRQDINNDLLHKASLCDSKRLNIPQEPDKNNELHI